MAMFATCSIYIKVKKPKSHLPTYFSAKMIIGIRILTSTNVIIQSKFSRYNHFDKGWNEAEQKWKQVHIKAKKIIMADGDWFVNNGKEVL